jgi:hypothetical protein
MKRFPLLAAVLFAPATGFSFAHTWFIQEVYSNPAGDVQFVEFFGNQLSSEFFLSGQTLHYDLNGVAQNTMTFSNATATSGNATLSGPTTLNKSFLVGTANLQSLYGIQPDYIISANFLSSGALKTLVFSASGDTVSLASLPTDGTTSLEAFFNNTNPFATSTFPQATATNFAGQTAIVPEPATCALVGLAAFAVTFIRRRRSA